LADIQWGDTATTKKAYVPEGYLAYSASGPDGFMVDFDFDRTGVVLSAIGANCGRTWLARGKWSCIKNTMRFWSNAEGMSTEYLFLATSGMAKWPKRGAAQPFISLGDARKIKILRPPVSISVPFGGAVSNILGLATNLTDQHGKLAACRDLLLPRLISGQLSVTTAERELEDAA
jgi:type I restriction enzyme S subunit